MQTNRTVPVDTVLPHLNYDDVAEAMAWLTRVFGAEEQFRYGEPAQGGQMRLERAYFMLASSRPGRLTPKAAGVRTQMITVFIDDLEGHYARVKASGAHIGEDMNTTFYGEQQFSAEDLAGQAWLFARHARDVAPAEWAVTP